MDIKIEINYKYDDKLYRALVVNQFVNGHETNMVYWVPAEEDLEEYAEKIVKEMASSLEMIQNAACKAMLEQFNKVKKDK